jgi:hypothetical protein
MLRDVDGTYGSGDESLSSLGNYRVATDAGSEHRVRYVETTFDARIMNDGLKVATAILTFCSAIMAMVLVYCCVYMSRAQEEDLELAKISGNKTNN